MRRPPVPPETKTSDRTAPGEREEGVNPLAPRPRGGVGEQSAPRLHRREPKSSSEYSGRAREGRSPLDFQSRPATCAAERLLAQGASKSLRDQPSEIEDFGWSPRVLIFSEGSLLPGEKIASLQIPRPEIRRISAESEKGWCGGESVPSAPRESSRGSQPSRASNQKDFRRKSYPLPHRGWQWRGSLLPRPHTTL